MPELGESSRVMEDEPIDIHVVSESLPVVEPVTAVEPELASEEESDPGEDPVEASDDGSPVFHTFEDDLMGEYADRIISQEHRIQELEHELHGQQDRIEELETEVEGRQETGTQLGTIIYHLLARNVELVGRLRQAEQREQGEKMEKEALRAELETEVADRIQLEEQLEDARDRVDDLEVEVRVKRRKMNRMGYAFRTAMGRWMDDVHHYPAEEGQTRYTMSRDLVVHMGQLEYQSAVERGMLP